MFRPLLLAAGVAAVAPAAAADEVTDKQKAATLAAVKKADLPALTVAETPGLLVFATLPAEKTKALADALQRVHAAAARALQYGGQEAPWPGKLSVVYVTEKKLFTLFVRAAASERAEGTTFAAVRGDAPWVAVARELPPKATDADLPGEAADAVAGALLTARAGTGAALPDWARGGFVRAAVLRAGGPASPRLAQYKARARAAVPRAPLANVWAGSGADADLLATALMDFLAYGPKAADFPAVVRAFKPEEDGGRPTPKDALESAGWKLEALDAAWKRWVAAGMPEAKVPPPK